MMDSQKKFKPVYFENLKFFTNCSVLSSKNLKLTTPLIANLLKEDTQFLNFLLETKALSLNQLFTYLFSGFKESLEFRKFLMFDLQIDQKERESLSYTSRKELQRLENSLLSNYNVPLRFAKSTDFFDRLGYLFSRLRYFLNQLIF